MYDPRVIHTSLSDLPTDEKHTTRVPDKDPGPSLRAHHNPVSHKRRDSHKHTHTQLPHPPPPHPRPIRFRRPEPSTCSGSFRFHLPVPSPLLVSTPEYMGYMCQWSRRFRLDPGGQNGGRGPIYSLYDGVSRSTSDRVRPTKRTRFGRNEGKGKFYFGSESGSQVSNDKSHCFPKSTSY